MVPLLDVNRQQAMLVDIVDSKHRIQPLSLLVELLAVRWQDIPTPLVSSDSNQTTRIYVAYEVSAQSAVVQYVRRLRMVSAALASVEDVTTYHYSSSAPFGQVWPACLTSSVGCDSDNVQTTSSLP